MLGTDQRDMVVPKLSETLLVLPAGGYVLDIGSGDGQTTSYALEGRSEPLSTGGSDGGQPSAVPGSFSNLPF
jgi:hypothetical protein